MNRVSSNKKMDARLKIQQSRRNRENNQPTNIYRTVSPPRPVYTEREFITREQLAAEEEEELLGEHMPYDKNTCPPLKVSCEFDRSEERASGMPKKLLKADYFTATRWKEAEEEERHRGSRRHKTKSSSSKSTSHMDKHSRREERNVRGRLGQRREKSSHHSERFRENPKNSSRYYTDIRSSRYTSGHSSSRSNVRDKLKMDRAQERRDMRDRLGAERRMIGRREEQSTSKKGIRRNNMLFVTDSEDSADEESDHHEQMKEEKWPKLAIHVQSDDDDTLDL